MEDAIDQLAARCGELLVAKGAGERVVIGIAGAPGSGKSTLASELSRALGESAVAVGMDGYHLPRAALDPEGMARRGAPFTFDARAFVAAARTLSDCSARILWPGFDHGVGDPVEGQIAILPEARVVICEGNYLMLDAPVWEELAAPGVFDERWFVRAPVDECCARVRARQLAVGRPEEVAVAKTSVGGSDWLNATLVASDGCEDRADVVVVSRPFEGGVPRA